MWLPAAPKERSTFSCFPSILLQWVRHLILEWNVALQLDNIMEQSVDAVGIVNEVWVEKYSNRVQYS